MIELVEKEVRFKFKGNEYTLIEPTVEVLERLEALAKKEDFSEMAFYCAMMKECGLDEKVSKQLSLRHLRQLTDELKKVK